MVQTDPGKKIKMRVSVGGIEFEPTESMIIQAPRVDDSLNLSISFGIPKEVLMGAWNGHFPIVVLIEEEKENKDV